MVEFKNDNQSKDVLSVYREANQDGSFQSAAIFMATKYQMVTLKEVEGKLSGIVDFEDQLKLLQTEYPCLYFLVCRILKVDTSEYKDFCKQLESHVEVYT